MCKETLPNDEEFYPLFSCHFPLYKNIANHRIKQVVQSFSDFFDELFFDSSKLFQNVNRKLTIKSPIKVFTVIFIF
jgi:hypothetical protein